MLREERSRDVGEGQRLDFWKAVKQLTGEGLWPDFFVTARPYQRIPFQWSWHYNDGSGSLIHTDFLATGWTDPRREFCETLLRVSGQFPGVIMAWSQFEEKVIRDMAEARHIAKEKAAS